MAGDIEWMGFYGSLLAVPTMLSVLGIVTNYNLEKSYFNSQLNAQYYKQTREMLRAHSAKLIQDQEAKFAKAGQTWNGMIFNKDGEVNSGVKLPMWNGKFVGVPESPSANANGNSAGGGAAGNTAPGNEGRGEQGGAGGGGTESSSEGTSEQAGVAASSPSGNAAGGRENAASAAEDASGTSGADAGSGGRGTSAEEEQSDGSDLGGT